MKKSVCFLLVMLMGLVLVGCKSQLKERLVRSDEEYLIYISSTYCFDCQSISDEVNQYIKKVEEENLLPIYKIVLEEETFDDIEKDYGVKGTPTLLHIKNGKIEKVADTPEAVLNLLEAQYGKL